MKMGHETKACFIGVMSGTSLDGVDVVLCPVGAEGIELAASLVFPFDDMLRADILSVIGGTTTLEEVGEIDHRLGVLFADAVQALINEHGLDVGRIEAIGLHGQTLWHRPGGSAPFTMQLGDPNIVAARTGIKTVADFRRKDMALGGQGAPFAPAFHRFLFDRLEGKTVVVNIGGMANITVIGDPLLGYDTGPGNVLMDEWCKEKFGAPFDEDGAIAQRGEVDEGLLQAMLADPYFSKPAPKSTGREQFNAAWLDRFLNAQMPRHDVMATLSELTARSIADEARRYAPQRVLLCGGGAKNVFLRGRIASMLEGVDVVRTDEYGIPGDWMEAMAFAWLAYKRINGEAVELKSVTGASQNTILGGLYA
jgi:anhydro-N-acetylmuramic acid kinase